jgi:hypothetical protein
MSSQAESEIHALRERIEALEREHADELARAHAALAAAQDRTYWLDRWNLDLNAVMRVRGARGLYAAYELLGKVRHRLRRAFARGRSQAAEARRR